MSASKCFLPVLLLAAFVGLSLQDEPTKLTLTTSTTVLTKQSNNVDLNCTADQPVTETADKFVQFKINDELFNGTEVKDDNKTFTYSHVYENQTFVKVYCLFDKLNSDVSEIAYVDVENGLKIEPTKFDVQENFTATCTARVSMSKNAFKVNFMLADKLIGHFDVDDKNDPKFTGDKSDFVTEFENNANLTDNSYVVHYTAVKDEARGKYKCQVNVNGETIESNLVETSFALASSPSLFLLLIGSILGLGLFN